MVPVQTHAGRVQPSGGDTLNKTHMARRHIVDGKIPILQCRIPAWANQPQTGTDDQDTRTNGAPVSNSNGQKRKAYAPGRGITGRWS